MKDIYGNKIECELQPWVLLAQSSSVAGATTTVSGLTKYTELLITISPQGEPNRRLGSTIMPLSVFITTTSHSPQGYHQVAYNTSIFGGFSFRGNNQVTGAVNDPLNTIRLYGR